MTKLKQRSSTPSRSNKAIESESFWAQSGLYLLWNRLFPKLSVKVALPSWSACECNVSKVLDGIQVEVVSAVFAHDATVLELEFTALDETEETIRIHPWNTTVDLRKCVNKNLRVSQIEKVSSVDLPPGEPRRVHAAYRAVKLSPRLRWIDVFVSIRCRQGRFVEDTLRIPYETLIRSLREKTIAELDNIVPQLANVGLLFLYIFSFVVGTLINAPLRYCGLAWYYRLPFLVAVALSCAMLLRWQFIQALANAGYTGELSVRSLYRRPHSVFDPATRGKEKRKRVSSRIRDYLQDGEE